MQKYVVDSIGMTVLHQELLAPDCVTDCVTPSALPVLNQRTAHAVKRVLPAPHLHMKLRTQRIDN
jgi:hypothetical protein